MDTFSDMRNMMLKLYRDALDAYPVNDEDDLNNNFSNFNSKEEQDELEQNESDRISYIIENIFLMDSIEQDKFLSLVILYYYSIITCYKEENNLECVDEFDDEYGLIDMIINEDKDTIINCIISSEIGYMSDLIDLIIEEDIRLYGSGILEKEKLEDFDEFGFVKEVLKNKEAEEIYKKFHPNLVEEAKNYEKYMQNELCEKKYSNMKINSITDFLQVFAVAKQQLINNLYMYHFLVNLLNNVKKDNEKVFKDIVVFILKQYYIKNLLDNNKDMKIVKSNIVHALEDMERINDEIIYEFIELDLNKIMIDFSKVPEEQLDEFENLFLLDIVKTYGTNGAWKEYSKEDEKILIKYMLYWEAYINNELCNNKVYIYYSENKDGEFLIPRLCLIVSQDNKVKNVLGIDYNLSIEFLMLDILKKKTDEFVNCNEISNKISILKYLANINEKVINNEKLDNNQIAFLYEINDKFNSYIFNRMDYRHERIKEMANTKKYLAQYFGCNEDEVATSYSELNENTVVTTYFYLKQQNCYYPKLRVIFSDAYGQFLTSAEGLKSLEYIYEDAHFDILESSKGLENLVRIDGNAYFSCLEDTSYLNPNLVIKGKTEFKKGNELKH